VLVWPGLKTRLFQLRLKTGKMQFLFLETWFWFSEIFSSYNIENYPVKYHIAGDYFGFINECLCLSELGANNPI
jgi:hypothetical protein